MMTIEFDGVQEVFYDHRKYTKSLFWLIGDNGRAKFPAKPINVVILHSHDGGVEAVHLSQIRTGFSVRCTGARIVVAMGANVYDLHIDVADAGGAR